MNHDIILTALKDLRYPSSTTMNNLTKRVAMVEEESNTVTRAVSENQNRLNDHDTQNHRSPTIESIKEAIEDAVSAAVDAGVIHVMACDSLDLSIKEEHFLSYLSASFLRHLGSRNEITRFTRALVEQTMNDYLTDQAANELIHNADNLNISTGPSTARTHHVAPTSPLSDHSS